jgi:lipopolysaccharide biosynthesis regulator YciM
VNSPWWLLVLFAAVACGYLLGRLDGRKRQSRKLDGLSQQYLQGLNFLLNEQPDKAVEVLVTSLDVTEQTLDTHLSLARLFRKRGEFDRATRIHSMLLESGKLPAPRRDDVELELARDYSAGGLLDRAEMILQQMLERGSRHTDAVRRALMAIFEQESDWHNALSIGDSLLKNDDSIAPILAHYCCELAQRMQKAAERNAARRTLRRALAYDKNCVRASIMLGGLELADANHEAAVKAWRRVRYQNPDFFGLVLDDLESAYEAQGKGEAFTRYLAKVCVEQPSTPVILKLAARLRERYGDKAASLFIADYMKSHPTVRGLSQIIDMNLERADGSAREHLGILKSLTTRLLSEQATFQCDQCGFEAHRMHWQCPTCKKWGSLRPLLDQEVSA